MRYTGIRVLLLEGYARQSLPLIRAFHQLGCDVSALCQSRLDVAFASRYTDHKILGICDREREEDTARQIRQLLRTGKYDVVVPTVDFSAGLLARHKAEFSRYAKVAANDWAVYQKAGDKLQTMEICMKENIPCPKTLLHIRTPDDLLTADLQYPLVMKPRVGYGAIGFRLWPHPDELRAFLPTMHEPLEHYVFQEYIPQSDLQYECAMFLDDRNTVKTALVFSKNRWFPVSGGSSTLNITVERPDIVRSCKKLLQSIGWRGAADIDLIQDPRDGTAKIMEINPRVSGSVKICFEAGVNQAKQMLELAYGQPVTPYPKYRLGQRLRCSQTDALWFLQSPDRFRAKPSWFSLKQTKDHTFYPDDPLPWLTFSVQGLRKLQTEMKKRSR